MIMERDIGALLGAVVPATKSRLRLIAPAHGIALGAADVQRIAGLDRHYRFLDGAFWAQPGSPWTLKTLWDEA